MWVGVDNLYSEFSNLHLPTSINSLMMIHK